MATTAHGLVYPDDYSDKADVPTTLQAIAESIEVALQAQDAAMASLINQSQGSGPMGMICAYGGTAAPVGWKICDGTPHGQAVGSALHTLLGSANVPDLRARFIVGVGTGYSRGNTGGADMVTLSAAQSGTPAHTHDAAASSDTADHTHSGNTAGMNANATHRHNVWTGATNVDHTHYTEVGGGGHDHGAYSSNYLVDVGNEGSGYNVMIQSSTITGGAHGHANWSGGMSVNAAHAHAADMDWANIDHVHGFTTGGRSAFHQHTVTVAASAAAAATSSHENRPPYYALIFIIKVV